MPDETVVVAFQSDIIANVDAAAAISQFNKLGTAIDKVAKGIKTTFDSLQPLVNQVAQVVDAAAIQADSALQNISKVADGLEEYGQRIEELRRKKEDLIEVDRESIQALKDQAEWQGQLIESMEEAENRLYDRISDLEETIDRLRENSNERKIIQEEEREEIGKTITAYEALSKTVRLLIKDYTSRITMSGERAGEFQVGMFGSVQNQAENAILAFKDMGGKIDEVKGDLVAAVEDWARRQATANKRSAEETEQIVKAWRDLFIVLVGRSIIPDLVNAMEYHLVTRLEKILGEHADIIRKNLLPKDASPEVVAKTFQIFVDEILKERMKLESGFLKESDVFQEYADKMKKSIEDMTAAEKKYVLESRVVDRTLQGMRDALRTYRDEIAGMPKLTPLNQIAKDLARQGQTIEEVTKQVNNLGFKMRKSAEQLPKDISAGFQRSSAALRSIPDRLKQAVYDQIEKSLTSLPPMVQRALVDTAKEMNTVGNLLGDASMKTANVILEPFLEKAREVKASFAGALKDATTEAVRETDRVLGTFSYTVGDALEDAARVVREKAAKLFKPITDLARDTVKDTNEFLLRPIAQAVSKWLTPLRDAAMRAGSDIGQGIASGVNESVNAINAARAKIESTLQPITARAISIGRNAGRSLVTGISAEIAMYRQAASSVANAIAPVVGAVANIGRQAAMEFQTGISMIGDRLEPYRNAIRQINDAFKPLDQHMLEIGRRAGQALMGSLGDQIELAAQVTVGIASRVAGKVGDALLDRFKYVAGSAIDILTFKGEEEKMRNKYQRALDLMMPKTAARVYDDINDRVAVTSDVIDVTNRQLRTLRQTFRETAGNVLLQLDSMKSGTLSFREGLSGMGTALVQATRVIGRHVGVTEDMDTVNRRFQKTLGFVTQTLSGYRRENEIVDKGLNRLATATDNVSNTLKSQAQIFIKQQELVRQQTQEKLKATAQYVVAIQAVQQAEEAGMDKTSDEWKKLVANLMEANQGLQDFGLAAKVFEKVPEDLEAINKEIEQFGLGVDKGISTKLRTTIDTSSALFDDLENKIELMTGNFPKTLSMFNRAIQDIEQNSKHFLTTLRDGGKISTERLQDILLAVQDLDKQMREMASIGAVTPEMQKYWENVRRNILLETENFAMMAQRARVVEAAKEKLFGTTKKVTGAVEDLGRAAIRNIPLVGEKAKLTTAEMERFSAATGKVRVATGSLMTSLSSASPIFGDIARGAQDMGQIFSATMEGMADVAAVKTAAMAKAFNLVKIAALGVIGLFGGIIVSTGKLAAEVTTLGITMRTVGRNLGVPIPYLENLVEVLKETGITTRESINAITLWMRAQLPFEFEDAVSGMTYTLDNLARASQQVAVAMGENSSETFARFIDFIQSGNSNLLKTVGIMKTANQMYEEYGKAIGKTVKAMSIQEKQQALISGLMKESETLTGVYTEAMKSASKQLGSMTRHIEQLRLSFGKYFEPILAMVIFRFNQLLKYLTEIPEETKKTITTFITVATAVSGLVLGLGLLLPKLKAVFGALKLFTGLLTGKFGIILGLIGLVANALGKMFMKIDAEGTGVEGIVNRLNVLLDSFGGLKGAIEPVQKWLQSFFGMIGQHVRAIGKQIGDFFRGITGRISEFSKAHPEIIAFLQRMKTVLSDLFGVIWRVVDNILRAISKMLSGDWEGFFSEIKTAASFILAFFIEFFNEVIKAAFVWGKNIITSFIKGLVDQARTFIPRAMSYIGQLIGLFLQGHSPAKMGPLSQVDIWGEGIMSGFLRGIMKKKVKFDEDMFQGVGALGAKAKLWGSNIIEVFTAGITEKAGAAIAPAMGTVGEMIARFLEGHSPPEAGRLAEIMDWGQNIFETFLAGFEMADFGVLDRAIDLIRQRMDLLVGDAENAGNRIAEGIMRAKEIVAEAISTARSTGGPLDLSALDQFMRDSFSGLANDIGSVVSALFESMKAEAEYKNLQDRIEQAREARASAIQAVEDQYAAITKQMEAEIEARIAASGFVVDDALMNELQRQLEEANAAVSGAQKRLEGVRGAAGKYGVNILTWEEINAQAQLDLANARKDQIEGQIGAQEQAQREQERIRDEVEAEYKSRLEALQSQLDSLKEINEAAAKAEEAELKVASEKYEEAKERADYLAALLEQRMKFEEDMVAANEDLNDAAEDTSSAIDDLASGLEDALESLGDTEIGDLVENVYEGLEDLFANVSESLGQPIPGGAPVAPDMSEMFREIFKGITIDLSGGIPAIFDALKGAIEKLWEGFKETPFGKWWEEIGAISFWETATTELGRIIDAVRNMLGRWGEFIVYLFEDVLGLSLKGTNVWEKLNDVLRIFFSVMEGGIGILGRSVELLFDLAGLDFEKAGQHLSELGEYFFSLFGVTRDELEEWLDDVVESIGELPDKIGQELKKLYQRFVDWFNKTKKDIVGNSIVPDMVNEIVDWITSIPSRLLRFASEFFKAAIELATEIYEGFETKISELITDIVQWFLEIGQKILSTATALAAAALEVSTQIFNSFKGKIDEIINNVGAWFSMVGSNIAAKAVELGTQALLVGQSIFNSFKSKIDEIITNVGMWFTTIGMNIAMKAMELGNQALLVGQAVFNSFKSKIDAIITSVGSWFSTIGMNIAATATMLWESALQVGQAVFNAFKSKIDEILNNILGWFTAIAGQLLNEDLLASFFNRAWALISQVYNAFYNRFFDPSEGIFVKIGQWIGNIPGILASYATSFYEQARSLGQKVYDGIVGIIGTIGTKVGGIVKSIWNDHLRTGFNNVLTGVETAINRIVDLLNAAWRAVYSPPGLGFPLGHVSVPRLPELALGGIVLDDIIAQLHAGEVVLPLDKLGDIMRNMGIESAPAFAPVMNFYAGTSPSQIVPAVHEAYDWYTEVTRRG